MIKLNWIVILAIIVLLVLLYLNNKEHFGGSASSTSSTTLNTEAIQNISSLYNTNDLSATNLKAQNTLKVGNNTIIKDGASIPDNTKGIDFLNSNNKLMATMQMKEENGVQTRFLAVPEGMFSGNGIQFDVLPEKSYIRHEKGPNKLNGLSISTINKGELRIGGPSNETRINVTGDFNLNNVELGKQILQWSDKGIDVTGDINLTGKIIHNKSIGPVETISTSLSGVPMINYKDRCADMPYTLPQINNWIYKGDISLSECQDKLGKIVGTKEVGKAYTHDGKTCWISHVPFWGFYEQQSCNSGNIL